jgi:PRC-barrel domain
MADPVSWFVIEQGWSVVDVNGEEAGHVDEVVGDSGNDIFNGLAVATTVLGRPRYVPAEQVGSIVEGSVQLTITKEQITDLGEYEEPATSAQILPEDAGAVRRAEAAVEAPVHRHEHRVNIWRRASLALRRIFGR